MRQHQPVRKSLAAVCKRGMLALVAVFLILPASPAFAQVGQSLGEFEKVSGKAIDEYKTEEGNKGLIFRDVWFSDKSKKQFNGRTAIEMDGDDKVAKEVFFFDDPLPNTPEGAVDAVGIAFNLLPKGTPTKFVKNGRRTYQHGYVLWFDYGEGRYINFFLDQGETKIEAVVGGVEATTI
jgi:hypothetical protein